MRALISLLREFHLRERPELFVQGEGVRPGILVLINEVDWELEAQLEAEVKDGCVKRLLPPHLPPAKNKLTTHTTAQHPPPPFPRSDTVCFISTLHGG